MPFYLKNDNKIEWLLQQNHRVDGMIEAPNQKMTTVHQVCCLKAS